MYFSIFNCCVRVGRCYVIYCLLRLPPNLPVEKTVNVVLMSGPGAQSTWSWRWSVEAAWRRTASSTQKKRARLVARLKADKKRCLLDVNAAMGRLAKRLRCCVSLTRLNDTPDHAPDRAGQGEPKKCWFCDRESQYFSITCKVPEKRVQTAVETIKYELRELCGCVLLVRRNGRCLSLTWCGYLSTVLTWNCSLQMVLWLLYKKEGSFRRLVSCDKCSYV